MRPAIMAMTLPLLAFSSAPACSGARVVQKTISVAAHAVRGVDETVAPMYMDAHAEALSQAGNLDEYRDLMSPWNRVEVALRFAQSSLLAIQRGVDSWESWGDGEGAAGSLACLLKALQSLAEALEVVGVNIPDPLVSAIGALGQLASGVCG